MVSSIAESTGIGHNRAASRRSERYAQHGTGELARLRRVRDRSRVALAILLTLCASAAFAQSSSPTDPTPLPDPTPPPSPITNSVTITDASNSFVRPSPVACGNSGETVKYELVEFVVDVSGPYTFTTSGNREVSGHVNDPFIAIYTQPFEPALPALNCLIADDDSAGLLESSLTQSLATGVVYVAVVTTHGNGATGLVTWGGAGVGNITLLNSVTKAEVSDVHTTGGKLTVQLTAADNAHYVVLFKDAERPSPVQIFLGLNTLSLPAIKFGDFPVSAAKTDTSIELTGLGSTTDYQVFVVAGNFGKGSGVHRAPFTTTTPPKLISSSPADNATSVPLDSTIVLAFDQSLKLGTGTILLVDNTLATQTIDVTDATAPFTLTSNNTVLTITPATPLLPGRIYHLEIAGTALIGDTGPFPGFSEPNVLNFVTVPEDISPDPFLFVPQVGVPPSEWRTSNAVTIAGINTSAPILIGGGTYKINDGPSQTLPSTVKTGDVVTVSQLSSAEIKTTTTVFLSVGEMLAPFSVTTGDRLALVTGEHFDGVEGPCLEGGVRLHFGIDYDDDGELSQSEVRRTKWVCNGRKVQVTSTELEPDEAVCPTGGVEIVLQIPKIRASETEPLPFPIPTPGLPEPLPPPGPSPLPPLLISVPEPQPEPQIVRADICHGLNSLIDVAPLENEDPDCANGGILVTTWLDEDNDGLLSGKESSIAQKVCDGLNVVVKTIALDPNPAVCPRGGVHLFAGTDFNANGELDGEESSTDQTICHGLNSLLHATTLSPGSEACPGGGIRIQAGTDANGNGLLDEGEISANEKVCNGLKGMVSTTMLDPKADECPTGGVQIDSGTDSDGDGVLDVEEIAASRKLCNGIHSLSRTSKLAPKANECPYGGNKIEGGLDIDGDGKLDDAEVKISATLCNGSNLAVRTSALEVGSADCPAGGSALESGIDTDGNAQLDDAEVQKRQVLCQPPQLLFETETLGENSEACPHGGLRVKSGHDDGQPEGEPGNGQLEAGEVELDEAVCLAPTDVLVSGGQGSCSVTPGRDGASALGWSLVLGCLGLVVRRRWRQAAGHGR